MGMESLDRCFLIKVMDSVIRIRGVHVGEKRRRKMELLGSLTE
jgi:hypothetical protein